MIQKMLPLFLLSIWTLGVVATAFDTKEVRAVLQDGQTLAGDAIQSYFNGEIDARFGPLSILLLIVLVPLFIALVVILVLLPL